MSVTWWLTSRGSEANTRAAPPFPSSFLYAYFSPRLVYYTVCGRNSQANAMTFLRFTLQRRNWKNAYNEVVDNFYSLSVLYPSFSKTYCGQFKHFLTLVAGRKQASFVRLARINWWNNRLKTEDFEIRIPEFTNLRSLDSLSIVTREKRDSFHTIDIDYWYLCFSYSSQNPECWNVCSAGLSGPAIFSQILDGGKRTNSESWGISLRRRQDRCRQILTPLERITRNVCERINKYTLRY